MPTDIQTLNQASLEAQAPSPEMNLMSVIAQAASNPNVDVEKMERLLAMQERIVERRAESDFNEAMNKCQTACPAVIKDGVNTDNKSRFAKLETVDSVLRPVYTKHGFSLVFGSKPFEGGVTVTCECRHSGGFSRFYELSGALDNTGMKGGATKTAIQGLGSSVSYLRRYLTCMIFNVIVKDQDNDGQRVERFITPSQVEALKEALGDPDRIARFCESQKLDHLGEIAATAFDTAMAKIKRAGQKNAA